MSFIIDYLGIIAVIFTAIFVYKKFKSGWFVKKGTNEEVQDDEQKQSRFQRWWTQSYIREIYVVRASQRKIDCFIPWIGAAISLFFVHWFLMLVVDSLLYPEQPFEKLIRYDGVVKDYVYHKKSANILVVQLPNGEKKYFHSSLWIKDEYPDKRWIDRNISVWVQQEWGILSGSYENAVWKELDGSQFNAKAFEKQFLERTKKGTDALSSLPTSLAWLFSFLALLWFINRNPVDDN